MTSRIPLSRKVVCAAKRRRLSTPEAPHETRGMKLNRLSHALGAFMTAKNGSRQEQAGTDPAGSPQPGAGNAGDQDNLRKSPAGPRTAEQKSTAGRQANRSAGKRSAQKKFSSARGRKDVRRSGRTSERAQANPSARKKLTRRKKKDAGGTKRRVR